MTYGPPSEPNTPDPTALDSDGAPSYPNPRQPWPNAHGAGWPGGAPPMPRPQGAGLAVVALVLGVLGCALPLLPMDLTGVRPWLPVPFGVAGLVFGILGCTGYRRGRPVAVLGVVLSVLAVVLGMIMISDRIIHG